MEFRDIQHQLVTKSLFLAALGIWLVVYSRRSHPQGDNIKLFMVGYLVWRFLIDFLKPGKRVFGVTVIQLVCVLVLVYYVPHLVRIAKSFARPQAVAES